MEEVMNTCSTCNYLKTVQHVSEGVIHVCGKDNNWSVKALLYSMNPIQIKQVGCRFHSNWETKNDKSN